MSCSIKRILNIKTPMPYKPIIVKDENDMDITGSCLYSWSTDGVCWTGWTNYSSYSNICPNIQGDFYLRILLFGGFSELIIDNIITKCYNICLYNENIYEVDWCDQNKLDIFSNLDCALQMQQQMADTIICMFGIPCYYFKIDPDTDTADFTFKEYVLHNVSEVKYLKLMCEDGQMPSSKPQMSEFDFDWENDWEVEMGKQQFAKAFGDTAFPKQRDIIYIPMMKRLYEVNSAYDEKQDGFMWRSTTWKLALVKYQDKDNVDLGDFEVAIDEWSNDKLNYMLESEHEEQSRLSGTTQMDTTNESNNNILELYMGDAIRKSITKTEKTSVIDYIKNNKSIITTRNAYKFISNDSEIIYQKPMCTDSGSMSFIIDLNNTPDTFPEKKLLYSDVLNISIKGTSTSVNINFNGIDMDLEKNNIYSILLKWNRKSFTLELNAFKYIMDPAVSKNTPSYLIRPEMYWFDYSTKPPVVGAYDNNLAIPGKHILHLSPYPLIITNIKVYNTPLNNEELIKESMKYSTTHKDCIISDVARRIETPHGYGVK